MTAALSILPRTGEVSPKVTEGEDTEPRLSLTSPSVRQEPATSPWRGRIRRRLIHQIDGGYRVRGYRAANSSSDIIRYRIMSISAQGALITRPTTVIVSTSMMIPEPVLPR